jgi:hypothetical protein
LGFAVANAMREQIFGFRKVEFKPALEKLSQNHLFPELFND